MQRYALYRVPVLVIILLYSFSSHGGRSLTCSSGSPAPLLAGLRVWLAASAHPVVGVESIPSPRLHHPRSPSRLPGYWFDGVEHCSSIVWLLVIVSAHTPAAAGCYDSTVPLRAGCWEFYIWTLTFFSWLPVVTTAPLNTSRMKYRWRRLYRCFLIEPLP